MVAEQQMLYEKSKTVYALITNTVYFQLSCYEKAAENAECRGEIKSHAIS